MNQRNNYSPERDLREREHYREKRREYSPDLKHDSHLIDLNRQNLPDRSHSRENSLIVENHMLTTISPEEHLSTSSANEQQWHEMNAIDEIDYNDRYIDNTNDNNRDDFKDQHDEQNQYFSNNNDQQDRHSIDRISIDYQRDNDTTFVNYDRDDDRYRDDGIFV